MVGMGFTKAELESYRDVEVPDLLPPDDVPLRGPKPLEDHLLS